MMFDAPPGPSTQQDNINNIRIICPATGKLIHNLPGLPDESVLFQERRKMKEKEKSIECLTQELIQVLGSKPNVTFNVKSLAEDLGDDVKRIYDICNVLEAVGIVIKKKVNTYCWMDVGGDLMMETLRHLKTIAESEDLHNLILNKEVVTDRQETIKLNLQVLTEKTIMLFLLLSPNESFTKAQLYDFIYRGAEENKSSGILRIAKVLKVLQSLGLLAEDLCLDLDIFAKSNAQRVKRFRYVGPAVTSFGDSEDSQLARIKEQAVSSHSPCQQNLVQQETQPKMSKNSDDTVAPVTITYEVLMLDDIEEDIYCDDVDLISHIEFELLEDSIIGRKEMFVKDEVVDV